MPLPLPLPLATNQTAGRSPFIATSSLAELYRRSVTPLHLPCISPTSPLYLAQLYRRSVALSLSLTLSPSLTLSRSLPLPLPLTLSLTVGPHRQVEDGGG